MPISTALLLARGQRSAVVVRAEQARAPLLRERGVVPQHRPRGEGHGDRAARRPPRPARASRAAPRARRCAPAAGRDQGRLCTWCSIASRITACQAGWNSTSSMRCPKRSCVRSSGVKRFAWRPSAKVSALPRSRRTASTSASNAAPPSRVKALAQRRVALVERVALERRRLVQDLVRGACSIGPSTRPSRVLPGRGAGPSHPSAAFAIASPRRSLPQ